MGAPGDSPLDSISTGERGDTVEVRGPGVVGDPVQRRRQGLAAGVLSIAILAAAVAPASVTRAAEPDGSSPPTPTASTVTSGSPDPALARGIIVKTRSAGAGVRGLAAASSEALAAQGEPDGVQVGPAIEGTTRLLKFDEPLPQAQAEAAATALEDRIDVEWAVPDLPRRVVATPVFPNDPSFGTQWDLWDSRLPDGGYSVKAPLVWGTTTGSADVVVAIIDTGITDHPDLDANVVPGYDFVSDPAMANDGDGRDPDPADPGDWVTQADVDSDRFGPYCDSSWIGNSSWHGTHVAGTIAAVQDNNYGISGVAPGVRIQPVRALGKCGGYDFDIVAAMTWAVGGSVSGVPDNPTPAKVVNMSLGGDGPCLPSYQQAIDLATSVGATVVVAAGNSAAPVTDFTPANCSGVLSVTATSSAGSRAYYSNYGVSPGQVSLSAPGGDFSVDQGIYSTFNSGATVPAAPTFNRYQGTSMATPHVAAGAALLYSLGVTGSTAIRQQLVTAVQPYPAGSNCTQVSCGAGILDLSLLAQAVPPDAPVNLVHEQIDASSIRLTWTPPTGGPPITGYDVQTSTDNGASWYDETTTVEPQAMIELKAGIGYRFRVAATSSTRRGAWSVPTGVVELSDVTEPGTPTQVRAKPRDTGITVTWEAPVFDGGAPLGEYVVTAEPGRHLCASDGLSCVISGLDNGRTYTVTVTASNTAGLTSVASTEVTATPRTTPGAVSNVTVTYKGSGRDRTAVIRWSAPEDDGGAPVTRYRAHAKQVGKSYGSWTYSTKRVVKLSVRQGKDYRVQIQARNAAGYGEKRTIRIGF